MGSSFGTVFLCVSAPRQACHPKYGPFSVDSRIGRRDSGSRMLAPVARRSEAISCYFLPVLSALLWCFCCYFVEFFWCFFGAFCSFFVIFWVLRFIVFLQLFSRFSLVFCTVFLVYFAPFELLFLML